MGRLGDRRRVSVRPLADRRLRNGRSYGAPRVCGAAVGSPRVRLGGPAASRLDRAQRRVALTRSSSAEHRVGTLESSTRRRSRGPETRARASRSPQRPPASRRSLGRVLAAVAPESRAPIACEGRAADRARSRRRREHGRPRLAARSRRRRRMKRRLAGSPATGSTLGRVGARSNSCGRGRPNGRASSRPDAPHPQLARPVGDSGERPLSSAGTTRAKVGVARGR